jgi:hypothetical protein
VYRNGIRIVAGVSNSYGHPPFALIDPLTVLPIFYGSWRFLSQKLEFCEKTGKDSLSSLTKEIQSLDDAFLALKAVEDSHSP